MINSPDNHHKIHWLYRPQNRSRLWWGFAVVLILPVLAQIFVHLHAYFSIDGWFGFSAVFGFISCVVMVLFAKLLGWILKRPEDYYDRD